MRTVCLVSHCWHYSRCLVYQLSSLALFPPEKVRVVATVFYCEEDEPTVAALQFFAEQEPFASNRVVLNRCALDRPLLLKRAIGRNWIAERTTADVVWWTDADYLFRQGALDSLADLDLEGPRLFFPRVTYFTRDRETGDAYADRARQPAILDIDPADFIEHHPGKAIGGVQIVPGDVARAFGYCKDRWRHQNPAAADCVTFHRNWSDTAYRTILGDGKRIKGTPIEMPGVYRIRQTEFGVVDQR